MAVQQSLLRSNGGGGGGGAGEIVAGGQGDWTAAWCSGGAAANTRLLERARCRGPCRSSCNIQQAQCSAKRPRVAGAAGRAVASGGPLLAALPLLPPLPASHQLAQLVVDGSRRLAGHLLLRTSGHAAVGCLQWRHRQLVSAYAPVRLQEGCNPAPILLWGHPPWAQALTPRLCGFRCLSPAVVSSSLREGRPAAGRGCTLLLGELYCRTGASVRVPAHECGRCE